MSTPHELFSRIAANRFLGFRLERCEPGAAVITMPVRADFLQEGDVVHGGIVSALADTTAAYALVASLPKDRGMIGVEFKVNFLRSSTLERGDLVARARALRQGRTVGVVQVTVEQAGEPIAAALFTFLFRPKLKATGADAAAGTVADPESRKDFHEDSA